MTKVKAYNVYVKVKQREAYEELLEFHKALGFPFPKWSEYVRKGLELAEQHYRQQANRLRDFTGGSDHGLGEPKK